MSLKYNTRDEIFEKIKKLVVEVTLTSGDELTRDTKIEDDLGCTGDDAVELMEAYFEKFNVHQGDFHFSKYFWEEGFDTLGIWYLQCKFKGIDYIEQSKYVTLGDLEDAVIAGVWIDSKIPSLGLENRSLFKRILIKILRITWYAFNWLMFSAIAVGLIYGYFFYEK